MEHARQQAVMQYLESIHCVECDGHIKVIVHIDDISFDSHLYRIALSIGNSSSGHIAGKACQQLSSVPTCQSMNVYVE